VGLQKALRVEAALVKAQALGTLHTDTYQNIDGSPRCSLGHALTALGIGDLNVWFKSNPLGLLDIIKVIFGTPKNEKHKTKLYELWYQVLDLNDHKRFDEAREILVGAIKEHCLDDDNFEA